MKVRESGMPEEVYWETFFDPGIIFSRLDLTNVVQDLAEFGSGYGTFTIPAAKTIKGCLYTFDIDPGMNDRLSARIKEENLTNVIITLKDFVKEGTGLQDASVDCVMLFNILHAENPIQLLAEAYRILKPGGKAGIIHWIYSPDTPRGPSLNIRPKPEEVADWLQQVNFRVINNNIPLPPYHYGILAIK